MFCTELEVREYDPGRWVLVKPLRWDDGERAITVPAGFVTDLASIPRCFRGVLNQNGASRKAAVLHDYCYAAWLYDERTGRGMTRAEADALFRRALAACGVGTLARRIYWSGVRLGGRRLFHKRTGYLIELSSAGGKA